MIRFACPKCKTVLENEPGTKFSCPGCGQRLQAPMPPENKTVMGKLVEPAPAAPPVAMPADPLPAPVGGDVQLRILMGREHVFWNCPLCQNPVDTPLDLRQPSVRCPHCSQKIAVPQPPGAGMARPPAPPPLEPEYVTAAQRETPPPYEKSRPRRRRRFADYDDNDDDYIPSYRRGNHDIQALMRTSTSGLTCSLIGLGMLLVVFLLWVVAASNRTGRGEALVFFILLADLGSFVLSLLGTVFSSRGLNPANESNRGQAVGGLVCGIIGLVISSVVGLVFLCIGLALLSGPTRWWG